MEWTKYRAFIAILMVIAGSTLTISTKWMDMIDAKGRYDVHKFNHPFVQVDIMFSGEILNLIMFFVVYKTLSKRGDGSTETNHITKGSRTFNPLIFWPPALMDVFASSMMYIGLTMTSASSYQMLRGSVIIFTAGLSKKKIENYQWIAILIIIFSLILAGFSDFSKDSTEALVERVLRQGSLDPMIFNDDFAITVDTRSSVANIESKRNILIGDGLIVMAQLVVACQMVYEEKYVSKMDVPPLLVVGYEGVFGVVMTTVFLLAYGGLPSPPIEDSFGEAFEQMKNSGELVGAVLIMMISTGAYNSAGVCVTKEINATTRMVLDSVRTLSVWIFSLSAGWQKFHWLQLVAFILLTFGTFLFNNILVLQAITYFRKKWLKYREPKDAILN